MADKESLEQTINTLEKSVGTLNDKLEESKERERLIVEYPDLNGPVNPDLTGMISLSVCWRGTLCTVRWDFIHINVTVGFFNS